MHVAHYYQQRLLCVPNTLLAGTTVFFVFTNKIMPTCALWHLSTESAFFYKNSTDILSSSLNVLRLKGKYIKDMLELCSQFKLDNYI